MKKLKSLFCILLLSTCLVGNVFAADTTGTGFFSFFSETVNAVMSFLRDDQCPTRQCTTCKPGHSDNGNGNCRPTEN